MPGPQSITPKALRAAVATVLLVGVLACHGMVPNEFVDWDDGHLVAQAPRESLFSTAFWSRIASGGSDGLAYYPVFHLSLAIDRTLWGVRAAPYHLGNVLLHLVSALLLLRIGSRLLSKHSSLSANHALAAATLAACLFAAHPLNVEPVAWVSGRKLVLAVLFSLAALSIAIEPKQTPLRRGATLLFFVLAALSNALALCIPLLLITHDLLLNRRCIRTAALLRVELFAIAAALALMRVRRPGVMALPGRDALWEPLSLQQRVSGAIAATWDQLVSLALPINQCNLYPVHRMTLGDNRVLPGLCLLAVVALVLWRFRRRRLFVFLTSWAFIGLLPTYLHDIPRADRHLYFAAIAVFLLVGWAVLLGIERFRATRRTMLIAAGSLISVCMVALTLSYVTHWRNSVTLWSNTARVNPENLTALKRLAAAYRAAQYHALAEAYLHTAIRSNPNYIAAYQTLAVVLTDEGRTDEAENALRRILQLQPANAQAHFNLGTLLSKLDRFGEAEKHLRKAVELNPDLAQARVNLANMLCRAGRHDDGIALYREAIARDPVSWGARLNLVQALDETGRTDEALREAERALALAVERRHPAVVPQIERYIKALRAKTAARRP